MRAQTRVGPRMNCALLSEFVIAVIRQTAAALRNALSHGNRCIASRVGTESTDNHCESNDRRIFVTFALNASKNEVICGVESAAVIPPL
jgi:hypothetical protein